MRFGKTGNNRSTKIYQYILTLFIFCICVSSAACQNRQQKIDAVLKQCQEMLDKDDLDGAYQCYLKVGKTYPENDPQIVDFADKSIFRKCVEFRERKDFEQAVFCLDGLTKLRPGGANIYFLLADSYYKIFKNESEQSYYPDIDLLNKAEEKVKKGLEIDPKDAPAHGLYGDVFDAMNKKEKALLEYRQAVKLAPKNGVFWVKLAMAQEKTGYDDIAIWSYKQALEINPNDDVALYFLGVLYEKLGKLDEAITIIEKQKGVETLSDETEQRLKSLKERRKSKQEQKQTQEKSKAVGNG